MTKKGCAACAEIGALCPSHRTEFLQWNARSVRRMLAPAVADVALGWICDCGARKSTPAAARCLSCSFLVPRVVQPRPVCACGGPASQASPLCKLCRSGRVPVCAHCGTVFYKPGRQAATCSPECAKARHKALADAARKHGSAAEKNRAEKRRRLERLRAVGGRQEPGRWRRICARDGWQCWICSDAIDPTLIAPHRYSGTADHVIALVDGGGDGDDNLRAAHFRCNSKRQHGGRHCYAEAVQ